jgi:outer membrane protein OmpA-like peptidoglycan-associated protein
MKSNAAGLVIAALMLAAPAMARGQQDVRGSKDHPLFPTRMPDYDIQFYAREEFGKYTFFVGKERHAVEGTVTRINYRLRPKASSPGGLAIRRNYANAITSVGGEVLTDTAASTIVMRVRRDTGEIWAQLRASNSASDRIYSLIIVETVAMKQVITADAMYDAISKRGFIALNILFETGSATMRAESMALVDQIAAMLKGHTDLALSVEGHTDDVGVEAANQKLSEARAASVVAALINRGIAAGRLSSAGFGESRPVADNKTESGREQNRRVELRRK